MPPTLSRTHSVDAAPPNVESSFAAGVTSRSAPVIVPARALQARGNRRVDRRREIRVVAERRGQLVQRVERAGRRVDERVEHAAHAERRRGLVGRRVVR